jgi:hypothetical protein
MWVHDMNMPLASGPAKLQSLTCGGNIEDTTYVAW